MADSLITPFAGASAPLPPAVSAPVRRPRPGDALATPWGSWTPPVDVPAQRDSELRVPQQA